MKWKGRRGSSNVQDARGQRVSSGAGGAGAGMLINLVGRTFGFKGILVILVIGFFLWQFGLVDPASVIGGKPSVTQVDYQPTAEEQERFDFVTVVLADTEDVWNAEFRKNGWQYEEPTLVIFKSQVNTACGLGQAAMGPFYCPGDKKVYIDLDFYDELAQAFQAPGDFAQAYVIAHEVGHHIQKLLGVTDKVHARHGQEDYNEWSVRLELQADFLAGVWANHNRNYLDHGDIEEAMAAANAIGDDTIQKRTQGRVVPHAFTHGTSEQRQRWFNLGLSTGDINQGDTFAMPYDQL
ncbi:MAG TPA: neutral zinc metallopeptidase [Xanthomonadales bacterium]|nr:neutral zinc metallopeptidase [Xanthomonadales bacterium]